VSLTDVLLLCIALELVIICVLLAVLVGRSR
jgi:hypothetical protein